jgi:hypothetical protein
MWNNVARKPPPDSANPVPVRVSAPGMVSRDVMDLTSAKKSTDKK